MPSLPAPQSLIWRECWESHRHISDQVTKPHLWMAFPWCQRLEARLETTVHPLSLERPCSANAYLLTPAAAWHLGHKAQVPLLWIKRERTGSPVEVGSLCGIRSSGWHYHEWESDTQTGPHGAPSHFLPGRTREQMVVCEPDWIGQHHEPGLLNFQSCEK